MTVDRSALTTLVCCGLVAWSGLASAQDAGEEGAAGAEGPPEGAPAPDGAAPSPPPDPAPEPAAATARWPRSVIARPLTLPKGLAQIGADVVANKDFSLFGLNTVLGFGVTDDLELTAFYGFLLEPFEAKGSLDADLGYKLARGAAGGKLEVIARARAGYNLFGEAANPLRLGAHVQYNVTDKIALITPGQQIVVSLAENDASVTPIFAQLPVAIGLQVTPELYAQIDTTLAQIEISDSGNAFIGADTTPVALTLTYNAIPALDVLVGVSANLTPPAGAGGAEPGVGDTLSFLFGFRYFGGTL